MLKTSYIRDGKNQIIGSSTSGLKNGDVVARDDHGTLLGRSSVTFGNTRDVQGRLVSRSTSSVDLLFHEK